MEKENEKQGEEEEKSEDAKDDSGKGDKAKEEELSELEKAEKLAERIEAGNRKTEELQAKQSNLDAKKLLAGKGFGGSGASVPKETNEEFTERFQRGEIDLMDKDAK